MAERGVDCVVFDVNETLFSLSGLEPAFAAVGLDPASVPLWFARLLRDAFALTALGSYAPFAEVAADALRSLDPVRVTDDAVGQVLAAFGELEPHPDVAPALQLLRKAGVPAVTLTNGGVELVRGLLDRAGLADQVRRCLSVESVRRFKPAAEPYRHAATELGIEPGRLALVAAHPWDCAGAHAAGLKAAWVNRRGEPWPRVFTLPDVAAADLPALVGGLLDAR
jgi:2-haloacid dehalogenase